VADEGGVTDLARPGVVETDGGLRIQAYRGRQYDLMSVSDLAITIPGTNTVELSFFGVPMVVALPLNHPERIPLEGLVGLIGNLPKLGKEVKRRILPRPG
jgi:lipid-A-disaccharide synthase